jgi:FtsH-binding integral membrane protein
VTREQIVVMNERLKAFSNFALNLTAALIAAVVARVWGGSGLDLTALSWAGGVLLLAFLAYKLLYLLETESE